jgi:hypothetical protein
MADHTPLPPSDVTKDSGSTSSNEGRKIAPPPKKLSLNSPSSHRQSFGESMRGMPPSPRTPRHPSFTQAAVQELLNHPPPPKTMNQEFAGRDWRQIRVGELVNSQDVRFVELDDSVEEATNVSDERTLKK